MTNLTEQFLHDRVQPFDSDHRIAIEDTALYRATFEGDTECLSHDQAARAEALRIAANLVPVGMLGGGVTGVMNMARWIIRGDLNVDYTEAR